LLSEWAHAGLVLPDLPAMRAYRLERIRSQLRKHDCDGALLSDPICVKYATDTTNMAIWTMHNQVRYVWVPTEGPVVMFEFLHSEFLSAHSEVIDEIRPAVMVLPILNGPRQDERAAEFAAGIKDLVDQDGRTGRRRVAIDVLGFDAIRALDATGIELVSGHQLIEDARLLKSRDEIAALRCAVHACQMGIDDMRALFEPGVTEVALWAQLQRSNLVNFGEWMETRILASGDRTNPWYHEASIKAVAAGEIMAFDTDLIGAYGMCVDMSRSWLCGDGRPSGAQADVYGRARDMVECNLQQFVAGRTYREVTEAMAYPPIDRFNGYTLLAHGVGLCDEYPSIFVRERWDEAGFDGVVEVGNLFCVEAFVGAKSGGEGVKLEQMILVTDSGPELLTDYSMDLV
ncbi:MAG: M24 family metallopeptidase, partial [Acidimicrobiales bacterium]